MPSTTIHGGNKGLAKQTTLQYNCGVPRMMYIMDIKMKTKTNTPVNDWNTFDLYLLINQMWYDRVVVTKEK